MKDVEIPTEQYTKEQVQDILHLGRIKMAMQVLPESFFALAASEPVVHQEFSAYLRNPNDGLGMALCRMVVRLSAEAKELRGGYTELLRRYPAGNRWVDTGE